MSYPTNLSFRRGIDVSAGFLYSKSRSGELTPVKIEEVTSLSAMSHFSAGYKSNWEPLSDSDQLNKQNVETTNIQTNDYASLSPEDETLVLKYGVAFHNGGGEPDACSVANYTESVKKFYETVLKTDIATELAERYIWNLVNGRTLWRNNYGIPDVVTLRTLDNREVTLEWGNIDRKSYHGKDSLLHAVKNGREVLESIISDTAKALRGEVKIFPLDVEISVILYPGAEVWPSQDFVNKDDKRRNGRDIGRHLSSSEIRYKGEIIRQGTMHPQKIGNAIRTIDEWYPHSEKAIAVEIYGYSKTDKKPFRPSGKSDAYHCFKNINKITDGINTEEGRKLAIYTYAIMLRGGVFGVSGKSE